MRSVHLQITGMVQGVGFRWFARSAARRLQVSGWVKNRVDGSVEVAASGREEKIEEFIEHLRRGPNGAKVSEVRELEPIEGDLEFPFSMRR